MAPIIRPNAAAVIYPFCRSVCARTQLFAREIRIVFKRILGYNQNIQALNLKGTGIQMNLDACRNEIDKIDEKITALLEARLQVVAAVAAYKETNHLAVHDGDPRKGGRTGCRQGNGAVYPAYIRGYYG